MTTKLIIITLIILLIYYYYQQNQPNLALDKVGYDNLIKDLKRQVQHYQTLYQKRVAHDLDKKSVEIQTDSPITSDKEIQTQILTSNQATQTPLTVKHSRDTQTSLTNDNIDKLVSQWNQVASWAQELGIDTNQKWNLGMMKNKITQELEVSKQKPSTKNQTTQTDSSDSDLESTLDNLISSMQELNKQL